MPKKTLRQLVEDGKGCTTLSPVAAAYYLGLTEGRERAAKSQDAKAEVLLASPGRYRHVEARIIKKMRHIEGGVSIGEASELGSWEFATDP